MLTFPEPQDDAILLDVARLPGVLAVEPVRSTDVFFEAGSRRQRNSLIGVPPGAMLNRILDEHLVAVQPRADGLTLSRLIAGKLDVGVGDIVRVTATDGHRASADLPVVAIVKPYLAASAYMELGALSRLLREPDRVTAAYVLIDRRQREAFSAKAKELPTIMSVSFVDNVRESVSRLLKQGSGFFATMSEQERDLATLRVLGFGRGEASYVLLAEMGALLLLALPLGCVLGLFLSRWLMSQFQTELFTFPYATNAVVYGRSVLFVTVAVIAATLFVRRGVDRLDLVGVLKSRD
jgi:putative ABC transport system permease protein